MLAIKPHKYQEVGISFAYRHYWTLIGDEQGLGKSLQALGLIAKVGGDRNLVVCPAMLVETWKREIEKCLPDYRRKIQVLSYNMFLRMEFEELDCLVFDECHYLKNHKAKRTKHALGWTKVRPPNYLVMLSGTPIKNNITEFFAPIAILSNAPWFSNGLKWKFGFHTFANTFSHHHVERRYGREIHSYEGIRNLDQLKKLLAKKYIRRLAKNNLELPPIVRKDVWLELKSVDRDLEEAWKQYDQGGHFMTLKTKVALAKAEATAAYAVELLAEGGQVIIYSDHREPVQRIEERLLEADIKAEIILGGINQMLRDRTIEAFKSRNLQALVMTIGAASEGLTLTTCQNMIFNDFPWVPTAISQAEKRIHRIGQESTVFMHYMLSGDFDKHLQKILLEKAKIVQTVTGLET